MDWVVATSSSPCEPFNNKPLSKYSVLVLGGVMKEGCCEMPETSGCSYDEGTAEERVCEKHRSMYKYSFYPEGTVDTMVSGLTHAWAEGEENDTPANQCNMVNVSNGDCAEAAVTYCGCDGKPEGETMCTAECSCKFHAGAVEAGVYQTPAWVDLCCTLTDTHSLKK